MIKDSKFKVCAICVQRKTRLIAVMCSITKEKGSVFMSTVSGL